MHISNKFISLHQCLTKNFIKMNTQAKVGNNAHNLINDKTFMLLDATRKIKGTTLIGIENYTNEKGEVSNQTIIAGITYENALLKDFKSLNDKKDVVIAKLVKNHDKTIVLEAFKNVYDSLEKRLSSDEVKQALREQGDKTILQSDAQINAYIHLTKGVKLCKDTQQIHVFGLVIRKTVINPIAYKQVNSRELTIVQNKIKKLCNFRQNKYRTFIFDRSKVNLMGLEIE